MNQIPSKIGNVSNIIGYVYEHKNYVINKRYIFDKSNIFDKSYALVSYNVINNICYHNESLLQVISFIKNVYINDYNELIYDIDDKKQDDIFNDCLSKELCIKKLYINDSCNLCTFIKKKYNLENIYDYPQFIIEYTEEENQNIKELFHNLFINREISKSNLQEMNQIKNKINELQKELDKIQNEENKNIFEDFIKKEEFIRSKL